MSTVFLVLKKFLSLIKQKHTKKPTTKTKKHHHKLPLPQNTNTQGGKDKKGTLSAHACMETNARGWPGTLAGDVKDW